MSWLSMVCDNENRKFSYPWTPRGWALYWSSRSSSWFGQQRRQGEGQPAALESLGKEGGGIEQGWAGCAQAAPCPSPPWSMAAPFLPRLPSVPLRSRPTRGWIWLKIYHSFPQIIFQSAPFLVLNRICAWLKLCLAGALKALRPKARVGVGGLRRHFAVAAPLGRRSSTAGAPSLRGAGGQLLGSACCMQLAPACRASGKRHRSILCDFGKYHVITNIFLSVQQRQFCIFLICFPAVFFNLIFSFVHFSLIGKVLKRMLIYNCYLNKIFAPNLSGGIGWGSGRYTFRL